MRVVVIGAGVIGCATALALAKRGADVVLLERAVPGAEASNAAAGILGASTELGEPDPERVAHLTRACDEYGPWSEELRRDTGIDIGYRVTGALFVPSSDAERETLQQFVMSQNARGSRAEMVDGAAARSIEPELSSDIGESAYFPGDAQVDPPALLRALVAAIAKQPRVTLRTGAVVERVLLEGGRCVGVALASAPGAADGLVHADATVLAAGSWSSLVHGIETELAPVRPARGHIVLLEERPPRLHTIVIRGDTYSVPRGDGRVLCGSTVEFVGYRREVTAGAVHDILHGAIGAVPALARAELAATWLGFRPHSVHPQVGRSNVPGLYWATGHFKSGIMLAKTTADEITRAILE